MPSDEEKIPEVALGSFVFTDQIYSTEYDSDLDSDDYEFTKPKPSDGKTLDKPGEELAHEATIWRTYLNEAQEHDQELVKSRNGSLDMLLLFATLFSAIVTAFLIESKNLLQQDPADASVALLLFIAKSQHRIELGASIPSDENTEPSVPDFEAPATARWINGIWFTSLGLSISAALIAMLSKEWLNAFLASRPRQAHSHALDRQARLEGLKRWWALYIIALLPSLLHVSVLLFSIGLVVYLWTLDKGIAIVLAVLVGATLAFYVITAVLGAIFEYCPFVTETSSNLRKVLNTVWGTNTAQDLVAPRFPTLKDIQALLWLADHAQDPVAVDHSYQAMAGLCKKSTETHVPNAISPGDPQSEIPEQLNDGTTLNSLLITINSRFKRLSNGSLDSVSNPDVSAARYLNAILGLSTRAGQLNLLSFGKPIPLHGQSNSLDMTVSMGLPDTSAFDLLETIEAFWRSSTSTLSANAYACILVSTMDIIHLVALGLANIPPGTNEPKPGDQPGPVQATHDGVHIVDFATTPPLPKTTTDTQLQILRAHYSQWLIRVSCLLHLYSYEEVVINTEVLNKLLYAMTAAAHIDILNPIDGISTHHPPIVNPECQEYTFILQENSRSYPLQIQKDDLHRGPLGALIELLRKHPAIKDGSSIQTCLAVLDAYEALAPVILQQVLQIPRQDLLDAFNTTHWPYAPKTGMMSLRFIATRQVLLTLRYLGLANRRVPSHFSFCENVWGLLNLCLQLDGSYRFRKDTYWALAHHSDDFIPILKFAGESEENYNMISTTTKFELLNATRVRTTSEGITPCDNLLTPDCFPVLIRMIGQASNSEENMGRLLEAIIRRMRMNDSTTRQSDIPWNNVPAIEYLYQFTRTNQGFLALGIAGKRKYYLKSVATAVIDIVNLAAGRDPAVAVAPVELETEAAPGFLDAVSVTIKHLLFKQKDHGATLIRFSTNVLTLLKVAVRDETSKEFLRQHESYHQFLDVVKRLSKDDVEISSDLKKRIWATLKDLIGIDVQSDEESGSENDYSDSNESDDDFDEDDSLGELAGTSNFEPRALQKVSAEDRGRRGSKGRGTFRRFK